MLNYINVFRALAIILIVCGHCVFIKNNIIGSICNEIFDGGTVLFVFISGFLFQHLSYKYETKTYFKKKFLNVISPYLITSIPGIIICFFVHSINPFFDLNKIIQIPIFLTTGWIHNPPTWYIPMTCIFFALAPILLYIERKKIFKFNGLYLLLPLLLLITIIFPRSTGVDVKSLVYSDYSYWHKYLLTLYVPFKGFINLFSVYILGMFFSAHKEKIKSLYNHRISLIVIMLLIAIIDILLKIHWGHRNISLSKIFLTLIILGYLEHYDELIISHEKINKIADIIAKYSFAIFFIHRYIIRLLTVLLPKINIQREVFITNINGCFEAIFIFTLFFVISFFGSLLIAWIIKQICKLCKITNTRTVIGA